MLLKRLFLVNLLLLIFPYKFYAYLNISNIYISDVILAGSVMGTMMYFFNHAPVKLQAALILYFTIPLLSIISNNSTVNLYALKDSTMIWYVSSVIPSFYIAHRFGLNSIYSFFYKFRFIILFLPAVFLINQYWIQILYKYLGPRAEIINPTNVIILALITAFKFDKKQQFRNTLFWAAYLPILIRARTSFFLLLVFLLKEQTVTKGLLKICFFIFCAFIGLSVLNSLNLTMELQGGRILAFNSLVEHFASLFGGSITGSNGVDTINYRTETWRGLVNGLLTGDNFLLGYGPGYDLTQIYNFQLNLGANRPNLRHPHNGFVSILLRFGFIGTLSLIIVLLTTFDSFTEKKKDIKFMRFLIFAQIFLIFVSVYLENPMGAMWFYSSIGFLIGGKLRARSHNS